MKVDRNDGDVWEVGVASDDIVVSLSADLDLASHTCYLLLTVHLDPGGISVEWFTFISTPDFKKF